MKAPFKVRAVRVMANLFAAVRCELLGSLIFAQLDM